MGGGLAFLTKKSFNPANWSNQKQVWEARQKDGIEKRRLAERESQLRREREEEDLARVMGGEEARGRKALSFMYEAGKVPGLDRKVDGGDGAENNIYGELYGATVNVDDGNRNSGSSSLFERQPGDDDAAAAFRAMLARGTILGDQPDSSLQTLQGHVETKNANMSNDEKEEDAINEARDRDLRTNLEKAVGRGITSGSGVTLAQQFERFPMLKGAPRVLPKSSGVADDGKESSETNVVGLNFKPLGQVLRNVKCLKCSQWGHSMGDRECGVSGWNPFAAVPTATILISSSLLPPEAVVTALAASAPTSAGTRNEDILQMKSGEEKRLQMPSSSEQRHKKHKRSRRATDKERSYHKRQKSGGRRHDRSPSNSSYSDSSSSSLSSRRGQRRQRHKNRRYEYYSDVESSNFDRPQHRSRKESGNCDNGHGSSGIRHKKTHSSPRRQKHRDRHRTSSRSRSR